MIIKNPILRGFNPDPSIVRVGDDYYIATSTFEWFPGVQIHHSRDLKNWQLVARPLSRLSQLDMRGNPDSCGVWAPCLTYDQGTFYLVYSNVRSFDGMWKDTPNYLVTSDDILGGWSDPIFLNSSGFDGSFFHDDDGRKWYTSMLVDHRNGLFFGGIILQEFDMKAQTLVGPVHHIFKGTALGKTEGPHLYKKDDYYYLVTAEGGTEYGHAVSLARSKQITGPYEVNPKNPLVTSNHTPEHPLQKCGHGDLVRGPDGQWYTVFLTGRPLSEHGRCTLGRETALEMLTWPKDEWPTLATGTNLPRVELELTGIEEHSWPRSETRDDFDTTELNIHFQSLRIPITNDWASLDERPGYLRLRGRESLSSLHRQSLVARRVQHTHIQASTCLEFSPENFQQMAGLVCYYNTYHYFYCFLSGESNGEAALSIVVCDKSQYRETLTEPLRLGQVDRVMLRVDFHKDQIQFYFSLEDDLWEAIGPTLDGSILSDDYVQDDNGRYRPAFTGSFVGICCQDLTGSGRHADFDWFEYEEIN